MQDSRLDEYLEQLVKAAQSHCAGSAERNFALTQLIFKLQQSKKLTRPYRGGFQGAYEEIYAEALQRLFVYICSHIDQYSPDRGSVLQWVNFYLSRRCFHEAWRELRPTRLRRLDSGFKQLSLDDLSVDIGSEESSLLNSSLSDYFKRYLQDDPNNLFQSTHIKGHPEANFQWITLKRLEGYSWGDLSELLGGIQVVSLSAFYQRCLRKFGPQIRADLG